MAFDTTHLLEVDATTEASFDFVNRAGAVSDLKVRNTAGEWCLETTGATTSNTPPTANPPGRAAYVYTEASTPAASALWTITRNTSFNAATQNVKIDFLWNTGSLQATANMLVEYATVANPNATTDWTTLTTTAGGGADAWVAVTVDFSVQTTTTLHYRIRVSQNDAAAWQNDFAISTIREYATDKQVAGKGMLLATAEKTVATPTEDPGAFVTGVSEEWGSLSVLFRSIPVVVGGVSELTNTAKYKAIKSTGKVTVADGVVINNLTFDSDLVLEGVQDLDTVDVTGIMTFETAGTYAIANSTVNEVVNTSGGTVIINSDNSTFGTNTGPNIIINNSVNITISVIDSAGSPIENSRIRLTKVADSSVVLEGVTDSLGVLSGLFNFSADEAISGWVRKNSFTPFYKQGNISGTITSSGFSATVQLVPDE